MGVGKTPMGEQSLQPIRVLIGGGGAKLDKGGERAIMFWVSK